MVLSRSERVGDELSEDEMSEDASEKPLGIEEFKQRVENSKKQESKMKKRRK